MALILPRPRAEDGAAEQASPSPASLREATSPRCAGRGEESEIRAAY